MAVAVKNEWVDVPSPDDGWVDVPAPKNEWVDVPAPAKERGRIAETAVALGRGFLELGGVAVGAVSKFSPIVGKYGLGGLIQTRKIGKDIEKAIAEGRNAEDIKKEFLPKLQSEHASELPFLTSAQERIESAKAKLPKTRGGLGGWAWNTLGEGAPQLATYIAAGGEHLMFSAMLGFAQGGEEAYKQAKKQGASETSALRDYGLNGLTVAALNLWNVNKLLGFKAAGKSSLSALTQHIKKRLWSQAKGDLVNIGGASLKSAVVNGLEEWGEEVGKQGISALPGGMELPHKEDGSVDWQTMIDEREQSLAAGALLGAVVPTGMNVASEVQAQADPSIQRIETLAEKIQTDPKLGEIEKAMLIRDLVTDVLPADHPAKRQTQFGPDVVQVWRGKESGKIYPETKAGGETRMETVEPTAQAGPGAEEKAIVAYHGSGTPITKFQKGTEQTTLGGLAKYGYFFGDKKTAERYAHDFFPKSPVVTEVSLNIEKPLTLSAVEFNKLQKLVGIVDSGKPLTESQSIDLEIFFRDHKLGDYIKTHPIEAIKQAGYDAIIAQAGKGGAESEIMVFDSKNIIPAQPAPAAEQKTRIVSTETGEELELDKDLTAKATAEARPPTIFDIPEATQKTLDAAKKVGDILIELEPQRGEFKEKMEAKKYGIWNRAEELVKKHAPEFGNIVVRRKAMAFAKQQLRESVPGLTERLSAEEHESLQRAINESTWYNPGEKMNLSTTLHELFDLGIQPDRSSIRLFDKFFGTNVFTQVQRITPKKWWKKIGWYAKEGLLEMTGGMKQLVTSFDFSAGGVQAMPNLFRHPIAWFKGTGVGYRAALSNRYTRFLEVEMKSDPDYTRIVENGQLPITKVGHLEAGEEMYRRGSWVQKISLFGQGPAASERAYVSNLNYQRFAVAKKTLEAWEGTEQSYTKDRELMDHIGNLTGRGKGKPGGWFEKYMELWSAAFWAPRLYKAVVDLPIDFIRLPHLRKIAARDAVQAFVLMGLTTYLASLIPGVEREDESTSSDFWKLKHGNTRYNPMGRYQQLFRLIMQMASGKVTSSTTGRTYEKDRIDILTHYLRGKLGPGPGMAVDIATGKTFKGEPLNEENLLKYIGEHVTPLFAQDLADAIRFQGLDSSTPFTVVLGAHGISTQTYEVTPTQETMQYKDQLAHEYFGADWDQLGEEAQKALREARPSIAEYERKAKFEQEDVTFRGLIAQEALNAGNKVTRKLPGKVQKELERLQVRVGELKRYSGNNWYLNQERYKQFQDTLTDALTKALPKITESEEWIGLNSQPDAQRAALEDVLKDAKRYAWDKIKAQANAEDFVRREDIINERETTTVAAK